MPTALFKTYVFFLVIKDKNANHGKFIKMKIFLNPFRFGKALRSHSQAKRGGIEGIVRYLRGTAIEMWVFLMLQRPFGLTAAFLSSSLHFHYVFNSLLVSQSFRPPSLHSLFVTQAEMQKYDDNIVASTAPTWTGDGGLRWGQTYSKKRY